MLSAEIKKRLLRAAIWAAKKAFHGKAPKPQPQGLADFLGRVATEQQQKEQDARAAADRLRRAQAGF